MSELKVYEADNSILIQNKTNNNIDVLNKNESFKINLYEVNDEQGRISYYGALLKNHNFEFQYSFDQEDKQTKFINSLMDKLGGDFNNE